MKHSIFVVFCTIFQLTFSGDLISSVPDLFRNDTLFVWAEGGLSLRLSNDIDSEKIAVIPYGKEVQFIQYGRKRNEYNVLFFKEKKDSIVNGREYICNEYRQEGEWFKVKYGDVEGYAFSGYLSRYRTPSEENVASIGEYIDDTYNLISKEEFSKDYDITIKNYYYEQGISKLIRSEKGGSMTIIFPNMTLEESLLLLRKEIEQYSINNEICLNDVTKIDGGRILYFTNNTNWEMRIESISGAIVITDFVWC